MIAWPARALIALVRGYQLLARPVLGAHCRFEPHCSAYAIAALRRHGAWRGGRLAVWRVLRCNPFGPCGHDPVPPDPTMHGLAAERTR